MPIFAALGAIKWGVIGLIVAALLAFMGTIIWQNHSLKADNAVLISNQAKLEEAVQLQKQTVDAQQQAIAEWKQSAAQMQHTLKTMAKIQSDATAQLRRIEDVYAEHNLRELSLRKPKLVEDRINRGTSDTLQLFKHATD